MLEQQSDIQLRHSLSQVLEHNKELKAKLSKFYPEFEYEFTTDGEIEIAMKLNGKTSRVLIDDLDFYSPRELALQVANAFSDEFIKIVADETEPNIVRETTNYRLFRTKV